MRPRGKVSVLTALSLGVLLAVALLVFFPLLGFGQPPVWLPAALLGVRLALRMWQARSSPGLRQPAAWVIEAVLIGMLLLIPHGPGQR